MSSPASALKLENVLYEKKGSIAYVTINRPKVLNALNAKDDFRIASRVRKTPATIPRCEECLHRSGG